MLRSLWTRGCSVLLIGVSLLGNGLPWQRAADDPYAFVPEPENTVQIACVGNSDLYSGFVPPVLWGNQGYSATVYASARQSLTKSYALLERVFATQSPELVVLETDMLYDHNPQEREMPRVLARQTRAKHLGQDMRNLASVFRQTGAQVTPGDFPSIRRTHGYRYSTKVTRLAMPDYMADTGEREQIRAENRKAADRIYGLLPEDQGQWLKALWEEFEAYETPEAKFAHVLDNCQPLFLNDASNGRSWEEHQVKKSQIYKRNRKTGEGSEVIWEYMKELIDKHIAMGHVIDDEKDGR